MEKSKESVKLSLFLSFISTAHLSMAVEESSLWLPASYSIHYLELKEAAETAEALDRCKVVLRATVDLEQSTNERRIYRVLCRQENNKTYNEMVDGSSMETLTTKIVVEEKLSPEELEQLRLEEEKRIAEERELRKLNHWNQCSEALSEDIRLMEGVEWVGEYPPVPDAFTDELTQFTIDFNAQDIHGQSLRYRALCKVVDSRVNLKISGRREPDPAQD